MRSSKTNNITVIIPEGKSSADYTVIVPEATTYTLYYGSDKTDSRCAFRDGYRLAKRIISGTVTLPDGEIAPAGGVIPEGLGSANYTLKVPPGKRISCQLSNFEQNITVCAGL